MGNLNTIYESKTWKVLVAVVILIAFVAVCAMMILFAIQGEWSKFAILWCVVLVSIFVFGCKSSSKNSRTYTEEDEKLVREQEPPVM